MLALRMHLNVAYALNCRALAAALVDIWSDPTETGQWIIENCQEEFNDASDQMGIRLC